MQSLLQPEPGALSRTDLPEQLRAAIEAATAAQREGAAWQKREGHRALLLQDDVTFLPEVHRCSLGERNLAASIHAWLEAR